MGADAWDVGKQVGQHRFKLCAVLIWSIHDLPAYGLLFGQVTKGYKGCLACGPNIFFRYLKHFKKPIYYNHRKWLQPNHAYMSNACEFNGKTKRRPTPKAMIGTKHLKHAIHYEVWKLTSSKDNNLCARMGVKHRSILFGFPYWKVNFATT
jgi:hypothetical protein